MTLYTHMYSTNCFVHICSHGYQRTKNKSASIWNTSRALWHQLQVPVELRLSASASCIWGKVKVSGSSKSSGCASVLHWTTLSGIIICLLSTTRQPRVVPTNRQSFCVHMLVTWHFDAETRHVTWCFDTERRHSSPDNLILGHTLFNMNLMTNRT